MTVSGSQRRNLIVRTVTREGPTSAGCVTVMRGGQVTAVSVTRDCQRRRSVEQRREYVTMWEIVRAVNVIVMRDTVVKCVNATIGTALTTTEAYVAARIMGTALVENVCVLLSSPELLVTAKRLKKVAGIITGRCAQTMGCVSVGGAAVT